MIEGVVDWFQDAKGYGFIRSSMVVQPILVHYSAVQVPGHKTLSAGQRVHFDVIDGKQGPRAINVYTEEMYKARLQISNGGIPLLLDVLLGNSRFLAEIQMAYNQLPHRTLPTPAWVLSQIVGFEPAKVTVSDVQERHVERLGLAVAAFEADFFRQREVAEKAIEGLEKARFKSGVPAQERTQKLAAKLRSRLKSLDPIVNKEQAIRVFQSIYVQASSEGGHSPE